MSPDVLERLRQRGVEIADPDSVSIGPEVAPERIAAGVRLQAGSRIQGEHTFIGPGSVVGSEGPAVVINCQLGSDVHLGSGYFESSVFLDGVSVGGNAHIRPGCLLEEQAGGAHAVGLKQTVLLPFVTLGSLINFCDCLMAGGTSRKNHSEVGSSYIHFNYTPRQDKATASLVGDVPRGVLLNQPPIFLGGQGGLVGPTQIAFGTIIPAGHIVRRDVLLPGQMVTPAPAASGAMTFDGRMYGRVDRLVGNSLTYIGNIKALREWYGQVREPFMAKSAGGQACHAGALRVLDLIVSERIKRLGEVAERMPDSLARLVDGSSRDGQAEAIHQQQKLADQWPRLCEALQTKGQSSARGTSIRERAVTDATSFTAGGYLAWVNGLDAPFASEIIRWLDDIVGETTALWER